MPVCMSLPVSVCRGCEGIVETQHGAAQLLPGIHWKEVGGAVGPNLQGWAAMVGRLKHREGMAGPKRGQLHHQLGAEGRDVLGAAERFPASMGTGPALNRKEGLAMARACFASGGGEGNWRISGGSFRHRVRVGCARRRKPRGSGPGRRCGPGSENGSGRDRVPGSR
jgi:hypothetical protein